MDVNEEAAGIRSNSVTAFLTNLQRGTALISKDSFKNIQLKGKATVTRIYLDPQEQSPATKLSNLEVKMRIKNRLKIGPLYLRTIDINGKPVVWPKAGEQATTFDEYGAPGSPYNCCGLNCEDLAGLFGNEEVSSLAQMMECVQAGDGLEHNMFEPDPTEPGPGGTPCHTIHHKFNSAYSSEKKVDRAGKDDHMEEDDPPPPPSPPKGDSSQGGAGKTSPPSENRRPTSPTSPPTNGRKGEMRPIWRQAI
jgi:hypothetical protein